MKFDFTGILDDGGFVNLTPGRYNIVTKSEWSAGKSKSNDKNLVLRIPFTVLDSGEFEGAQSSFFHTIMADGAADKMRTNKVFTLRLLTALGLVSDEDRGAKGELEIEYEFGAKEDNDRVPLHSLIVNGQRRSLEGCYGVAVVVVSDVFDSGVAVKTIEPPAGKKNGAPKAAEAAPAPAAAPKSKGGFPF